MVLKTFVCLLIIWFVYLLEPKENHKFSELLFLMLLIVLMGGSYGNADWEAYRIRYIESASGNFLSTVQWAQYLFGYICNLIGLKYEQYRLLYYTVGMLLIYRFFKIYTKSVYLPLLFYAIDPMIIDATQSKNFMMMAIMSNALPYLMDRTLQSKAKYIMIVILAAGFQITAYAYLPLVIFCDVGMKRKYRLFSVLPIIMIDLAFARKQSVKAAYRILLEILQKDTADRMESYGFKEVHYGYLVYWLATILVLFLLWYAKKITRRRGKQNRILEIAYLCDVYAFAFFPLHLLAIDFSRLFRNFAIINHAAISDVLQTKDVSELKNEKYVVASDKAVLMIVYLIYLFYVFYFDVVGYRETVLLPFFEKNILL